MSEDMSAATLLRRFECYAEQEGGAVTIRRTKGGEALLSLSLAAAENLAHQLEVMAAEGRHQAKPSVSEATP